MKSNGTCQYLLWIDEFSHSQKIWLQIFHDSKWVTKLHISKYSHSHLCSHSSSYLEIISKLKFNKLLMPHFFRRQLAIKAHTISIFYEQGIRIHLLDVSEIWIGWWLYRKSMVFLIPSYLRIFRQINMRAISQMIMTQTVKPTHFHDFEYFDRILSMCIGFTKFLFSNWVVGTYVSK